MADGVLLAGEAMGLLIAEEKGALDRVESFRTAVAGAEFNVAVGLRRLGHRVAYLTRLGDDPFGHRIRRALREEGIPLYGVRMTAEHPTGLMLKSKTAAGDPAIFYYRRGSAASFLGPEDVEAMKFDGFRALHLTGIFPALSAHTRKAAFALLRKAKERHIAVFFDPNIRLPLWKSPAEMRETLLAFARESDVVMPGITEGRLLTGEESPEGIARVLRGLGARTVIVKLGAGGAYADAGTERFYVPGYEVETIVDTVGAGDGFAAGVISALGEGLSLPEAVRRGNAVGAIQLGFAGDNEGLPDRDTLARFQAEHAVVRKAENT